MSNTYIKYLKKSKIVSGTLTTFRSVKMTSKEGNPECNKESTRSLNTSENVRNIFPGVQSLDAVL